MKTTSALVVLAMVLAACSGNGADSPTTTTQPTTTTTTAPTTTTTTSPDTTTTTVAAYSDPVTVYVLDESGSNGFRQGPFLYPIAAEPRGGVDEIEAALESLVAVTEFDTSIPAGTTVDSVSVDGTVARVDLSDEFASGGGSASMFARLAQLTFTLTAIEGIDAVLLVEDGTPVEVFSSEGIVLDGPMVRDDFEDLVPGILVDSPPAGAVVDLPFDITGIAAAHEGVFRLQILDGNEVVFEPDFLSTDSGVGWGSFEVTADLEASPGTTLTIRVWEHSARDGSVISERFVPVVVAG